jgi:hypothetical protein
MTGPATQAHLDVDRPTVLPQPDGDHGPALRRRAIDWRPILLESFFVVLGVVLALATNEWRQGQVERRRAVTALESIREELAANRQAVLGSVNYHGRLMDTLSKFRQASPPGDRAAAAPDIRLFSQGFVHPAAVLTTAWETAVATDAVRHMAHDDVLALARMYEQQRSYAAQSEQIGRLIYSEIFNRGTGGVTRNYVNLSSIISTFWFRECDLLAGYDQVLAKLPRAGSPSQGETPALCRRVRRR